ncbi:MAG: shikimate kinase [Planctomycetaceae bacterium]|nr:shikimate kinase [Planctomycetaceae bacterium]MCL2305606.1 shikimate kinase [Planctomycetaceae bacterium]
MQTPLILIGYRATGKTTLAQLLAARLNASWYDSDLLIENRAGKSIARIFAEYGEPTFRDWEAEEIEKVVLGSLQTGQNIVLATGGGAILRESTRSFLKKHGFVVWLTASKETIYRRMNQDATTAERRPDLTNLPAEEEIALLLEKRKPFYEETAHLIVDTENESLENLVETILEKIRTDENHLFV